MALVNHIVVKPRLLAEEKRQGVTTERKKTSKLVEEIKEIMDQRGQ